MPYSEAKLADRANHLGYDLLDLTGTPHYRERKGKVWGLLDRRNGKMGCICSTLGRIKKHLEE
jgi:hypothetical protein